MADALATESPNKVTIENAGPARKRITITIPAEAVGEKIESSFATLASEATLPGFRRGHAPRKLIERRFGTSVLNETRNQIVAEAYSQAIEEHKVRPVGEPEGDQLKDLQIESGKDLTFTIEVEVAPEFELPALDTVQIKRPLVEVTQKHIDEELLRQTYRHGTPEEITDEVKPGDRLLGRALVTNEKGETINDMAEAIIVVPMEESGGKGHVLGLFVEDMFSIFVGRSVGDAVTVEAKVAETDEHVALRGQSVKVEFTIQKGVRVTPATEDAVVEVYGLGTRENLVNEVKSALDQRAKQEQQAAMREQLCEHLLDAISIELPEKLSASQAKRSIERSRVELLYRGLTPEEVEVRIAEMRQDADASAGRRLKLFFILHRLAEQFGVQVTEQEINGRVAMIAAQRGERPEKLRSELAQQGRLQQIAMQIREHKAMDRALEKCAVTEISAEEWNAQVAEKAKATADAGSGEAKPKRSSRNKN